MPLAEWACYAAALPALDADQTLRQAEAAAIPWMPPADRRRTLARLQHALGVPEPPATPLDGFPIRRVRTKDPSPSEITT